MESKTSHMPWQWQLRFELQQHGLELSDPQGQWPQASKESCMFLEGLAHSSGNSCDNV
jgi:hypothetical protein